MKIKKFCIAVVPIFVIVLILTACGTSATPTSVPTAAKATAAPQANQQTTVAPPTATATKPKPDKVKVAYSAFSGDVLPWWLAQDAGLFAKYNLEVDLQYIASSTTAMQALLGGDVNMITCISGSAVVASGVAGSDVVAVAGVKNAITDFFLMVDPSIKSVNDLKGKKLGVTRFGGLSDFYTRLVLNKLGMDADKDVTILQIGDMPAILAAMKSKAVDGGPLSSPTDLEARKMGFSELTDFRKITFEYPSSNIVASKSFIKNKPDIVRNFIKATIDGIYTAKNNKELSLKVLEKYLKNSDQEILRTTYEVYAPAFEKVPYPKGMQIGVDETAKVEPKAKGSNPNDFMDTSLLAEIEKSGFIDNLYTGKK